MQFPRFSNFSTSSVAMVCHWAVQRGHNKDQRQNSAPLVPWPLQHYLSKLEGGRGGGHKQRIQSSHIPHVTGIWSSSQTSVHCLTCCTAAHLKQGPNVALSSPQSAAIECFLARLGKSLYPPLDRLGVYLPENKSDNSTAGHLGGGGIQGPGPAPPPHVGQTLTTNVSMTPCS